MAQDKGKKKVSTGGSKGQKNGQDNQKGKATNTAKSAGGKRSSGQPGKNG